MSDMPATQVLTLVRPQHAARNLLSTVSYVAGHKGPTVLREPRQLSGRGPPAPNAGMQPGVSQHRLFS